MKKCDVGGQALFEGVLMRGTKGKAIARRKDNGKIDVQFERMFPTSDKNKIISKPFIRGTFILIESLKEGLKALTQSNDIFEDTEPSKFEDWIREKFGDRANDVIANFTIGLSIAIAVLLFIVVPTVIPSIFTRFNVSPIFLNIIEVIIRIGILVLYMYAVSLMDDINKVLKYHGAEHKTIACYEAEEELTVENVKKFSRFHPRCGTNFLFLIMFISILVFLFTGWGGFVRRVLLRILLLPVVVNISYEIIKWLGKSESKVANIVAYPGLKLQKLTTKEPDDEHIEVAIASLMSAEQMDERQNTIGELLDIATKTLKEVEIDTARLDSQLILGKVIDKDKLYLITNRDELVDNVKKKEFLELIEKRKNKMPVRYILGECDFMGLDFYVEEGVLIPRSDTEVLVEEVLKLIEDDNSMKVCDLCCGSGAIGISLAHYKENIEVDLIDYYPIPEKVTKKNITRNNLDNRVFFIKSNLLEEPEKENKKYDIIVSNPPYIKEEVVDTLMSDVKDYEPRTALSGGEDGLVFYRKIVEQSKNVLVSNGILAFEIGYDQGNDVKLLMELNGFEGIRIINDLAGLNRVVIGKLNC